LISITSPDCLRRSGNSIRAIWNFVIERPNLPGDHIRNFASQLKSNEADWFAAGVDVSTFAATAQIEFEPFLSCERSLISPRN
jgi:hypothetical protein